MLYVNHSQGYQLLRQLCPIRVVLSADKPQFTLIAGPNGAGKSTFAAVNTIFNHQHQTLNLLA
jgi:ABC-type Mn2+/Zn2+ transport system ATPase subunit